jgi:RNA polymerase sigma factor (sigma-70 family)
MNFQTEQELIDACLKHDSRAQFALFEKYKKAMYTLAYRLLNDTDKAQDCLQEGFIDVFSGLKNFRGESTLGAWIKQIMIRKAYKLFDKHINESIESIPEESSNDIQGWIDGEMLDAAIRSLPEKCRVVFILIEVEGYGHKEVAGLLNISDGTSKSQLNYAKKLLQHKLNQVFARSHG